MILERSPDQLDAMGEQRGGQRVAGEAVMVAAVEAERDPLGAIDMPAGGEAAHRAPPSGQVTEVISCVKVSRATLMKRRQP